MDLHADKNKSTLIPEQFRVLMEVGANSNTIKDVTVLNKVYTGYKRLLTGRDKSNLKTKWKKLLLR